MTNPYLPTQIFLLFLSLAVVMSCGGQNNTSLHKDRVVGSKTIGTKHTKVFKSQPTKNGEAENVRCGMFCMIFPFEKENFWIRRHSFEFSASQKIKVNYQIVFK